MSSRRVLTVEYPHARVLDNFSTFLQHFVLTKLTTSSQRVKGKKTFTFAERVKGGSEGQKIISDFFRKGEGKGCTYLGYARLNGGIWFDIWEKQKMVCTI